MSIELHSNDFLEFFFKMCVFACLIFWYFQKKSLKHHLGVMAKKIKNAQFFSKVVFLGFKYKTLTFLFCIFCECYYLNAQPFYVTVNKPLTTEL